MDLAVYRIVYCGKRIVLRMVQNDFFLEIHQKCAMINAKWRTVGETNDTG